VGQKGHIVSRQGIPSLCVADKGAAASPVLEGVALVGGYVIEVGGAAVPEAGLVAPSRHCVWHLNVPAAVGSN